MNKANAKEYRFYVFENKEMSGSTGTPSKNCKAVFADEYDDFTDGKRGVMIVSIGETPMKAIANLCDG